MKKLILFLSIVVIATSCSNDNVRLSTEDVKIATSPKTILDTSNFTNAYYFDLSNTLNFPVYVDISMTYITVNKDQKEEKGKKIIRQPLKANKKLEYLFYQNADTKVKVVFFQIIDIQKDK